MVSHASDIQDWIWWPGWMCQGLFVFGSESHFLRSHFVVPSVILGSSEDGIPEPSSPNAVVPPLSSPGCGCACWKEKTLDYPSSVTPWVSSMDIFVCPFQFQLKSVPQADLLVDCFCDLCRSRRVQGPFIFKPEERWKSHDSKISCRARSEHQRGENVIVLLRQDDVRQVLMLGDFFNWIICLKKKVKFEEMKGGQMSLVGTAGKHSLGRGRKSRVEAEPKGKRFSWDGEAAPGRVRLWLLGVLIGRGPLWVWDRHTVSPWRLQEAMCSCNTECTWDAQVCTAAWLCLV